MESDSALPPLQKANTFSDWISFSITGLYVCECVFSFKAESERRSSFTKKVFLSRRCHIEDLFSKSFSLKVA